MQKQVWVILTLGADPNPVFPFACGEANHDYFSELGVVVSFYAFPEGHTISRQNYRDFRLWLD